MKFISFVVKLILSYLGFLFVSIGYLLYVVQKAFISTLLRWIPKMLFLSLIASAFLATIEQGLKPLTAETMMMLFLGINFIAVVIYEGFRYDSKIESLVVALDNGILEKVLDKIWGKFNSKAEKVKNDQRTTSLALEEKRQTIQSWMNQGEPFQDEQSIEWLENTYLWVKAEQQKEAKQ